MRGKNYTGALHDQRGLVSFDHLHHDARYIADSGGFYPGDQPQSPGDLTGCSVHRHFMPLNLGVNDALSVIESKLASSSPLPKQDTCSSAAYSLNPDFEKRRFSQIHLCAD